MNSTAPLGDDECALCRGPLHAGTEVARCPSCGALYHAHCLGQKGCVRRDCGVNLDGGANVHGYWNNGVTSLPARPKVRRGGRDVSPRLLVLALCGAGVVAALGVLGVWWSMRPAAAAQRAYSRGLRAQLAGDLPGAQAAYEEALGLQPGFAEVELALGYALLGFHGEDLRESDLQELSRRAQKGDTRDLEAADEAFSRCVQLAAARPGRQRVAAVFSGTNQEMMAVAWTGGALTALTRAAAAYGAGEPAVGNHWVDVATGALGQAEVTNPDADTGELRRLAERLRWEGQTAGGVNTQ